MLLSTPLSLLLSISALKGADDVVVERQFNAVIIQNGLKVEVGGSGPEAYVVEVDGARVPPERARWQDDVLQILNEDGGVLISLPLSSWGSMDQGATENLPPKKMRGLQKQLPKKAAPGFLGIQMAPIDELPANNADGRPWDLDASRCTMIAALFRTHLRPLRACVPGTSSFHKPTQCRSSNLVIHHRGHATRHCCLGHRHQRRSKNESGD